MNGQPTLANEILNLLIAINVFFIVSFLLRHFIGFFRYYASLSSPFMGKVEEIKETEIEYLGQMIKAIREIKVDGVWYAVSSYHNHAYAYVSGRYPVLGCRVERLKMHYEVVVTHTKEFAG